MKDRKRLYEMVERMTNNDEGKRHYFIKVMGYLNGDKIPNEERLVDLIYSNTIKCVLIIKDIVFDVDSDYVIYKWGTTNKEIGDRNHRAKIRYNKNGEMYFNSLGYRYYIKNFVEMDIDFKDWEVSHVIFF